MHKYYYTDSLAAAWMAKHFGMVFVSDLTGDSLDWENDYKDVPPMHWNVTKHYIHDDSLKLLEPQINDVILTDESEPMVVNYDPELFDIRHGIKSIIQRNGIAFMMPESEGV